MKEAGEISQRTHIPLDKDNHVVMARGKVGWGLGEAGNMGERGYL